MCEPTTLTAISIGVAVVGAGLSYKAQTDAASATQDANNQAATAQNDAFNSRMDAQRRLLSDQTAINTASASRFTQNQAATQEAQIQALGDRADTIKAMNDQQAITSDQANKVVQQGTDTANSANLANQQVQQTADQQAMNAPVVAQIQATNPLGAASTGVTKDALDTRLKGAADYAQNYGDTQAKLTGYAAPIALANNAATTIGTNLMPAGVMDQLVRTSAPAILNPSTTAYQNAGTYGRALGTANDQITAGAQGVAQARSGEAIDLATLNQNDTNAVIQSKLIAAQTKAAQISGIGSGLSAVGNAGISYAGSQGAFADLLKKSPKNLPVNSPLSDPAIT